VRVRVLFFGVLKDITGRPEEEVELPAGARAGDVFARYAAAFPKLATMERSILIARNQRFAARTETLAEGDEIALLPPVSGGASENHFALTRAPIDTRAVAAQLVRGEDGAVVTFEGVARNNSGGRRTLWLEYECYEPMALRQIAELGESIAARPEVGRVAIVHRLGRLEIGETSVAIVVTAPHRKAAFEAAREAIDRLKRTVAIWKKEHFEDGEVWVEGEWDSSLGGR
jgi:molybdopterin converting factor subunit 1